MRYRHYEKSGATNSRFGTMSKTRHTRGIRLGMKDRIGYRFLHLAGQQMRCLLEMYGARYRLTLGEWKVLGVIGFFAPMSSIEVSEHTSLEPDKVSRTTEQLVRANLVTREKDPRDRRRVVLSLSAEGKRAYAEIEKVRHAIEVELLTVLNERELNSLYSTLNKLDARANEIFAGPKAWRRIVESVEATKNSSKKNAVFQPAAPAKATRRSSATQSKLPH